MREFFEEHRDFQAERPALKHSPIWWLEKMREEWAELYVITSNDPTEQDRGEIGKELSDIFWTVIGLAESLNYTPHEFEETVLAGMDKIHQAYPVELFDGSIPYEQAYAIARPDKIKPIDVYNPSASLDLTD